MIKLMIQFNGKQLTIPINPEEISIKRSANNDDIDIIGLGKTVRKGEPGLRQLSIESFFPAYGSYFYTGVKPRTCVEFIEEIWYTENTNNNVAKIVSNGLPIDINMYFVIDSFEYDHKAGEEEDIYYNLQIKEYKAYGVKTVDVQLSGLAAARAVSPIVIPQDTPNAEEEVRTYTVQSGDCLWNIAKASVGNGSRWPELYELNTEVIGNNPNLIYPGQVLILPDGWDVPNKVTKLKSTSKSKNNTATKKSSETPAQPQVSKDERLINAKASIFQVKRNITKGITPRGSSIGGR